VFVAELPDDLTIPGDGPLEGSATHRPFPPRGVTQRRLTFTANDPYPGIQGPRHWLRSSSDGLWVGFLKKDADGVVQFWTVNPGGGSPTQVTRNQHPIASAFTWHPDGRRVAFVMDGSVCIADVTTGETRRLTDSVVADPIRPEACVFSPDGSRIAFVRQGRGGNQLCVADL
jgi:Tol biopolymer transport system component